MARAFQQLLILHNQIFSKSCGAVQEGRVCGCEEPDCMVGSFHQKCKACCSCQEAIPAGTWCTACQGEDRQIAVCSGALDCRSVSSMLLKS